YNRGVLGAALTGRRGQKGRAMSRSVGIWSLALVLMAGFLALVVILGVGSEQARPVSASTNTPTPTGTATATPTRRSCQLSAPAALPPLPGRPHLPQPPLPRPPPRRRHV